MRSDVIVVASAPFDQHLSLLERVEDLHVKRLVPAPTAHRLRMLLVRVWRDRPTTVVFVTHNLREVIQLADRIVVLSHAPGTIQAEISVTLSRSSRYDAQAIEDFRHRLVTDQPEIFQDL